MSDPPWSKPPSSYHNLFMKQQVVEAEAKERRDGDVGSRVWEGRAGKTSENGEERRELLQWRTRWMLMAMERGSQGVLNKPVTVWQSHYRGAEMAHGLLGTLSSSLDPAS